MSDNGVRLGAVQQTLMIPLYGRAVESRKRRPLLSDPRAVQIVESIDYDFTQMKAFKGGARGAVLRTSIFDALREAGFTEVEVVWQDLEERVLIALMP